MTRTKLKYLKILMGLLIIIQTIIAIANVNSFYQEITHEVGSLVMVILFITGLLFGLLLRAGLTFIFWYGYHLKYQKEGIADQLYRRVIASLLFLLLIYTFFGEGFYLIFFICTLYLKIRNVSKKQLPLE
ncbi:hypothetical protein [Alkaliphilus transvaalensis]|uniref:hypothetical protein n=1 Tax=Alkaliphilus transvaalensis TaxID=114628 RepID=UPI00047DA2E2|nr:hypothetical protein [Alkaliphilus transvaalensis]